MVFLLLLKVVLKNLISVGQHTCEYVRLSSLTSLLGFDGRSETGSGRKA
jgi:hypothetical protein